MIVDQQDVDTRLYISMLISIVQQNHINILCLFICCQVCYPISSILVNSNIDMWELTFHLKRFITNFLHGGSFMGKYIALALAFVSTRQHSNFHQVAQEAHQIFHMRRLSRSTNSNIAHGDDGNIVCLLLENAHFKHLITHSHP